VRITVEDYLMGREKLYPCSPELREHAAVTVGKVNSLLAVLEAEGVPLEAHPKTQTIVSSGWRPPQINSQVKGAAPRSKHMTGDACDLYDPEGDIDEYLMEHPDVLLSLGIFIEHPSATKGWCHIQTIGPRSGRRIFYP
jgi:hypothetical protein